MHSYLLFPVLAALAAAKTDLSGCTTSNVIAFGGASVLYYVPGTGEICSFLDCGGGMAPPKSTVPGCPLYSGTATYSPSFLPGFKEGSAAVSSTTLDATTTTSPSTAMITGFATTDGIAVSSIAASSTAPIMSFISGHYTIVSSSEIILTGTATPSSDSSSEPITTASPSSSGSSTTSQATSQSTSATSSAPSSASTGNAGASNSVDLLAQGMIGAAAAGLAFLL